MNRGESDLANVIGALEFKFADLHDGDEDPSSGRGNVAAGQVFPDQADRTSDSEIASRVTTVIEDAGFKVRDIGVVRPFGPAIYVRVVSESPYLEGEYPGGFTALSLAVLGRPFQLEGSLLQVELADGTMVASSSSSLRSGASRLRLNPKFEDLAGAIHG